MSLPKIKRKAKRDPMRFRPSDLVLCFGVGFFGLGAIIFFYTILATSGDPTGTEYTSIRGGGVFGLAGPIFMRLSQWLMAIGAPITLVGYIVRWIEKRKDTPLTTVKPDKKDG